MKVQDRAARPGRPARFPALVSSVLLASVLLPACVVHVPDSPPPLPQISREEAVDRAFDFAQRNGYRRVSIRSAGRDGDAWDVHLRVERPFRGKVLVFLDAFTGEVLRADVFRERGRHHGHGDDEDEGEGRRDRGHEGRDEDD